MKNSLWKTLSVIMMVLAAFSASGQKYPDRPVRILTSETGSGTDVAARVIALGLAAALGQQVVIDNRALFGALDIVSHAPPDGYTLLFYGSSAWLSPFMSSKVTYDPLKAFAPVTLAMEAPGVLVVNAAVPVKSVKELIALAKARPGELNYSSGSIGGSAHLAAELFKSMTSVNLVRIQYRGSAPSLNAVIAGEVQVMFPSAGSVTPHVKSGRLRLLAVTSAGPSALLPGLPTVAESGLPGYESVSTVGMLAPGRTPAAIVTRLYQETERYLHTPELKDKMFAAGLEIVASTPQQFTATIKTDMAVTGKLIRDLGITAN